VRQRGVEQRDVVGVGALLRPVDRGGTVGPEQLAAAGVKQAYALTDIEPDLARCLAEPGPLLERLARKLAEDWLSESEVEK